MLEIILRWLLLLPFAFITFQIYWLNKKFLPSPAWKCIAAGNIIFLARSTLANLKIINISITVTIFISLIAFGLIALGFQLLRNDLMRIKKIKFDKEE